MSYLPSWQVTSTSEVGPIELQLNKESTSIYIKELWKQRVISGILTKIYEDQNC